MMLRIVITNYNQEKYTKALLDSLVNQVDDNVSVIIVDDCSTDNSLSIIKEHPILKLKNTVLFCNEVNQWVSYCRNVGIGMLNDEDWITFIDGDDFVQDNYIDALKTYLNDAQSDVYVFDYNICPEVDIDASKIEKANNEMCWSRLYRGKFLIDNKILFKDWYKKQGFGEDWDFNQQVISKTDRISYKKDLIYNYRWMVKDSLSNKRS